MAKSNQFYTKFNPPPVTALEQKNPSMTQQSFSYETDINNMVKTMVDKNGRQHAVSTGVQSSIPPSSAIPKYGDFTIYTP